MHENVYYFSKNFGWKTIMDTNTTNLLPKVVHCRKEQADVYVGRPTKWGNPFHIGRDGDRETVIRRYEEYILENDYLLNCLHELKGKTLSCWCAPLPCHADVLVRMANPCEK